MRQPRNLNESDLQKIALKVRHRLSSRFGSDVISKKIKLIGIGYFEELLKATYTAVREQLEEDPQ